MNNRKSNRNCRNSQQREKKQLKRRNYVCTLIVENQSEEKELNVLNVKEWYMRSQNVQECLELRPRQSKRRRPNGNVMAVRGLSIPSTRN